MFYLCEFDDKSMDIVPVNWLIYDEEAPEIGEKARVMYTEKKRGSRGKTKNSPHTFHEFTFSAGRTLYYQVCIHSIFPHIFLIVKGMAVYEKHKYNRSTIISREEKGTWVIKEHILPLPPSSILISVYVKLIAF